MDGTIYLEDKMIEGAFETLNYLIENKKHILFVTNKTTQTRSEYTEFLQSHDLNISTTDILTAADNSVNYLKKNRSEKKFYAIAEDSFINSIEKVGLVFTDNPDEIEIVIISLDRNYSRNKFEIAEKSLINGAEFLAANIDNTCPVIKGEIVDAGTIISELELSAGKHLQQHFGKPSEFMISSIEDKMHFNKNEYLLIGDRMETDILMGIKMGVDTVLVKSGVKNNVSNSTYQATFNVTSIQEIL